MQNHCNLLSDTYTIQNGYKQYDFKKCLSFIENKGKQDFGQNFKIKEEDLETIFKLLIYMIKDENNALKLKLNLSRGILLSGSIGCGKTSLMRLITPFANSFSDYKIKTCREISFEFAKNGYEAINTYATKQNNQIRLTGYCFDDLGTEQQIKHFGNDCNVMAEILITRYEQFVENNSITHITTNLAAFEIKNHYGNRLRSRMRNRCNGITFSPSSSAKL